MIFSILVFDSLIISLIATSICHSLSTHPQSKKSHHQPQLEKRGGSVSSRSSSCSSLDSKSASPPDASVLKTDTIEEDRDQCQKIKGVRSDAERLKRNEARRNIYACKKMIEGDTKAFAAWKLRRNEAGRKSYARKWTKLEASPNEMEAERKKIAERDSIVKTKRLASFVADPAKKIAWRLKERKRAKDYRLKKKIEYMEANPDEKEEDLMKKAGAEIYFRAKTKRHAAFVADPTKKTAWRLKERKRAADYRLKKKNMDAKNVADIPKIVGGHLVNKRR
jgi:hypothetical protein